MSNQPIPDDSVTAFVVQIDGSDVGLALREPRGFRFLAADRRFAGLEGRQFRSSHALEIAARQHARRQRSSSLPV